jgi:sulfite reductase (NADPH) flavoprotein alpha-component
MAQQDCGQCGYMCETYSMRDRRRHRDQLNLCVPGGKETSRMLKGSLEQAPAVPGRGQTPRDHGRRDTPADTRGPTPPAAKAPEHGTRDAPVDAVFRMATRLNGKGSEKDTRHVVLDIAGSGLAYAPGDSFGLYPKNDPALAEAILAALRVPHEFPVRRKAIRDALIEDYALGRAPTCC